VFENEPCVHIANNDPRAAYSGRLPFGQGRAAKSYFNNKLQLWSQGGDQLESIQIGIRRALSNGNVWGVFYLAEALLGG
jgi:hypothetical protein